MALPSQPLPASPETIRANAAATGAEGVPKVLLISDQRISYDQAVRFAGGKQLIVGTLDHAARRSEAVRWH
ncbi:hypothetical protein AJ88_24905 [Mesorhizobium amorphae CCBAU 01583]|nr:hypothetical protein AJ88_24905 [Mesorhizobium amorphae CCBAU 01583]